MPLVVNRKEKITGLALAMGVFLLMYLLPYLPGKLGDRNSSRYIALLWTTPVIILFFLWELMQYFAMLHFVPEGIAITLGKRTVRQTAANRIVLLAGVRYRHKSQTIDYIAVCGMTAGEMAELQALKTPKMLQNSRTKANWLEEMAGKYLLRESGKLFGRSAGSILWIEWTVERYRMLRELYPEAQWLDTTEKKLFDSQLTN